ncbi:endopeptidase La [Candidatus Calescamantes bacterium]|nr:endopeptidase La [Candidatus Calescamantes bacterium]
MESSTEEKSLLIPSHLPILPLRDTVIFPGMILPLLVGRPPNVKLLEDISVKDKIFGVLLQKDPSIDEPKETDLYTVGCVVQLLRMLKLPTQQVQVLVQGISRMRITNFSERVPYFTAYIEKIEEKDEKTLEIEALMRTLLSLFEKVSKLSPHIPQEAYIAALNIPSPGKLADFISAHLPIPAKERQKVLETIPVRERIEEVTRILSRELEVLELKTKIEEETKAQLDKAQREFFLRQQLEAIKKELGEEDERTIEIRELETKIKEAKMPPEVEKEARRELDRLAKLPPHAAEYTVIRTYLDWLINLPWSKTTQDNLDIERAKKILDEDHYNLNKVKERILDYLAVRKLKADMKGPILCFVGPPGVGKTSLGQSIARALGRKFVRISLGGVRDEAEIRGHRRTYVGALPGRIIQGIRRAGTKNPVFMLDEVDKIGLDFRGDPSAALLEVLDPEQNHSFMDHYLDVPFDLSQVMFITTANILDTIPPALRDRMEVLELPGYTEEEKVKIAERYLIPRQIKENGLEKVEIEFTEKAIRKIIRDYTREAGVRNLEREIANVLRKIAKKVAEGNSGPFKVKEKDVETYLGPQRYFMEVVERTREPGVATGLAWTPHGGEIIFVEATKMRGKKSLTLTGQLGEVMQESAKAALSFIRSRALDLGIPEDFFEYSDIHIHVPHGAIPKDGPSAGVTIATALVSLLTNKPVKGDVAMTGEITLKGKVLPVGGIKEKVLAAHRAGVKTVILPEKNKKDLEEIPEEIRKKMRFIFVKDLMEVFSHALTSG